MHIFEVTHLLVKIKFITDSVMLLKLTSKSFQPLAAMTSLLGSLLITSLVTF